MMRSPLRIFAAIMVCIVDAIFGTGQAVIELYKNLKRV